MPDSRHPGHGPMRESPPARTLKEFRRRSHRRIRRKEPSRPRYARTNTPVRTTQRPPTHANQVCCMTRSALLLSAALLLMPAVCAAQSQWEADIAAFESADRSETPPHGAALFVGSSSIRMWTTLAADFEGTQVINRGFGGSRMADLIHYVNRIVMPYAPRVIVVYEGDNDIASGMPVQRVMDDYRRFVSLVRNQLPDVRIAFIAIKPSLARWDMAPEMKRANASIEAFAAGSKDLDFIDVWVPMLGDDGRPMPDLFLDDGLHMNEKGYAIWMRAVAPFLSTE